MFRRQICQTALFSTLRYHRPVCMLCPRPSCHSGCSDPPPGPSASWKCILDRLDAQTCLVDDRSCRETGHIIACRVGTTCSKTACLLYMYVDSPTRQDISRSRVCEANGSCYPACWVYCLCREITYLDSAPVCARKWISPSLAPSLLTLARSIPIDWQVSWQAIITVMLFVAGDGDLPHRLWRG
jgi:hypothetical protein